MPADTPVVFPIDCPACAAPEGVPYSVTAVDQNHLLIRVRCRACEHEWTVDQESVVEFAKKPDRRQQSRTDGTAERCYCCNQRMAIKQRRILKPAANGQSQTVVEEYRECTDASCLAMRRRHQPPLPQPAMSK